MASQLCVVASSPGKIILFGEHGVHRQQPNITTMVDMRTYCRVTVRTDDGYSFRTGDHNEAGTRSDMQAYKIRIDGLRAAQALDEIARVVAGDFFSTARYVLGSLYDKYSPVANGGLDIEWHSELPIGSGLGSGAAASSGMVRAAFHIWGYTPTPDEVITMAWQGDVIAHGGYGSSLDSSTCVLGGLIRYTLADKASALPYTLSLPLVVGDTLIEHRTAQINTHIRQWLQAYPEQIHIFRDMGYLLGHFLIALERSDFAALGNLLNLHQLLQEKMGTSTPESEALIQAALRAGALGAKISGSGGGGIIIALAQPGGQQAIVEAINAAGGHGYAVRTGGPGTRLEPGDVWNTLASPTAIPFEPQHENVRKQD